MDTILGQLVDGVIDGPEDLMGIGECLNLLDKLEESPEYQPLWGPSFAEMKRLFNGLILEDSPHPDRDWERIRALTTSLKSGELIACDAPSGNGGSVEAVPEEPEESAEVYDTELIKDFIEEAREHLSAIELNMLTLEANPEDQEAINAVFRPFHSIKGVAGFLNLKDIHHLSHEVENLLDAARSGLLVVTDAVIDIVLNAVDILKVLLGDLDRLQAGEIQSLPASPLIEPFLVRVRAFNSEGGEVAPVRARRAKLGELLVESGAVDTRAVEKAMEEARETGRKLGEELIAQGQTTPRDVSQALREQRRARENAASVRIDTRKLDNLVDMVGELVIAQTMVLLNPEVLNIRDQKLQKDSVQLKRITSELQRISMSMRMVPIKSTFQKMIRLVRDLAKKSGKEVSLVMKGEETEIDRNMVEEIYEPLVHMIRNSIDHGLEMPDERARVGKDASGTVLIAAEQKGGNIVIDVSDDGRGLDVKRIRSKAIERGIIGADDQLDEKAIYELIMHPGFSTKDQVTEVSGRGVGMDVVKKSVEALHGKLEVDSVPGKGTHFQLKLPLTMAIIDGMVIRVGEERYVVPTIAMRESLKPQPEAYVTVQGRGELIKVRESLMPLVRLHAIFGVTPRFSNPWDGLLLVVNEDNHSYCLMADEIIGRQEVVIKSLGGSLQHVAGISGGAILGDGKVALIVDVKGIVTLYEESTR